MARRRPQVQVLLPDAITRMLALYGPVQVAAGLGRWRGSGAVHLAPFDDLLLLFVPPGAPLLAALARDPQVELQAAGGGNGATLRVRGRAVECGPASAHERRLELVHWLPEGASLGRFRAVELFPERIEYAFDQDGERRYFEGNTAAAKHESRLNLWLEAAYGGVIPTVVLACAGAWAWLGWYGQWYHLRLAALVLVLCGALGLLACARLAYRGLALRAWRQGRAPRAEAGPFAFGLLPVRFTWIAAVWAGVAGLGCAIAVGAGWGMEPLGVSLACSQLWYLGPWWIFRLLGPLVGDEPA